MTGQPEEIEKYTKIPNDILEALAKAKLNGTQHAICLVIFRNTFGFHRCQHEMSATYIGKATNISTRQIKRELQALNDRNIILKTNLKKGVTSTVGFNKDITAWQPVTKKTPVSNPTPAVVSKKTPAPVSNPSPNKERIKENIKEKYIVVFQNILEYWNKQKIIIHQKLNSETEKALLKALKQNTEEEIRISILHYSKMIHDDNYSICNYKWSLANFLSREKGYRLFLDDGEKWINYLNRDKPKPPPKPKPINETASTAAVINGGYINFYDGGD